MTHWRLATLSLLGAATARAETIYDQPYLGDHVVTMPARELAADIADAELIMIGRSKAIVEHRDASGAVMTATGTVSPVEVWKGSLPKRPLQLSWSPSATSVASGSLHLLFVDLDGKRPRVLREMYIHAPPYDRIRAFGALDGDKQTTFRVVRALIDPKASRAGLADLLVAEVHAGGQQAETAVQLAVELDASEAIDALAEVVADADVERDDYARAASALVKRAGVRGVRLVLAGLVNFKSIDRVRESDALGAIATVGGTAAVPVVAAFAAKHVRFRVSAAFALAKLGGTEARDQLAAWIADPASSATEKISTGWTTEHRPRIELYRAALATMKP